MNIWQVVAHSDVVERIGWTLLHSLWQLTLTAAVVSVVLWLLANRSANARYVVGCAGLAFCTACPIVTFLVLDISVADSADVAALQAEAEPNEVAAPDLASSPVSASVHGAEEFPSHGEFVASTTASPVSPANPPAGNHEAAESQIEADGTDEAAASSSAGLRFNQATEILRPWLPAAVTCWLLGACLLAFRPIVGLLINRWLKKQGVSTVPRRISRLAADACKQLQLNRVVEIAQSTLVKVPCVVGWFAPVILLPASAVTGLSENELRSIILHELTHVRRHDYLVNLLQTVVESLLFYHPLVWWLSSHVRAERENCCDDLVLAHCEDRTDYVRALMQLETTRGKHNALAIRATGGSLVKRVRRIAGRQTARIGNTWLAGLIVLSLLAIIPLVQATRLAATQPDETAAAAEEKQDDESKTGDGPRTLKVTVLRENGEPVANAKVVRRISSEYIPFRTDENGVTDVPLPAVDPRLFVIYVSGDEFTPAKSIWWNLDNKETAPIPTEFTFKVREGKKISGRIVDEAGKPIAGATVELSGNGKKRDEDGRVEQAWYDWKFETNEEGVWSFPQAPAEPKGVYADVTHPDYVDTRFRVDEEDEGGFAALFSGEHSVTMEKGITVRGKVTDAAGKPLRNVKVLRGVPFRGVGPWETRTNATGEYEFSNVGRDSFLLTVVSPDYAPQLQRINDFENEKSRDFQLKPGKPIRFQVVDDKDQPVAGVRIVYDTWLDERSLLEFDDVLPQRTDENGELVWNHAPDEAITYDVLAKGFMSFRDLKLQPDSDPHKIKLIRPLEISGKVVSKATGQPVPKFSVLQGEARGTGEISWDRYNTRRAKNGKYYLKVTRPRDAHHLRIEADDYKPAVSRAIENSEGEITINFELERSDGVTGTILDPEGPPIKGAKIYYSLPGSGPYVRNNASVDSNDLTITESQMGGQFLLPEQDTTWAIMVVADEGYAYVYEDEFAEMKREVKVTPWATIRGKLMIGDKPGAGEEMTLNIEQEGYMPDRPHKYFDYDTKVNEDGTFEFTRVPPGATGMIGRQIIKTKTGNGTTTTTTHGRKFEVAAGESLEINIGGTGRPLTGKLKLPEGDDRDITEWNRGFTTLKRITGPAGPDDPDATGYYNFRIKPDGTFRADDIPQGDYELSLRIHGPGGRFAHDGPMIGTVKKNFTIPAMEGGRSDEPFDLGTLEVVTPGSKKKKRDSDEEKEAEATEDEVEDEASTRRFRLKIVRENGEPVANAHVGWGDNFERNSGKTDENGGAEFEIPVDIPKTFSVFAHSGDFVPVKAVWQHRDTKVADPIPEAFTFTVRGGKKISGKVVDDEGKPIAGAKVKLDIYGEPSTPENRVQVHRYGFGREVLTDDEGSWSYPQAPDDARLILARITHPKYANAEIRGEAKSLETLEQLFAGTHSVAMADGMKVHGTIIDPDGKPVQNARILLGERDRGKGPFNVRSNAEGKFEYTGVRHETVILTVVHKDFAPEMHVVSSGYEKEEPVEIQLKKGKPLRMLIVDEKDQPIPGVRIIYYSWRGFHTLEYFNLVLPMKSDSNGEVFWPHAPEDPVSFDVLDKDHMTARGLELLPRDEPHRIVLCQPLEISGKVVTSGKELPLPKFKVIPGFKSEGDKEIHWELYYAREFEDGTFDIEISYPRDEHFLKIEADGFKPGISEAFKKTDGKVTYNFTMKRGTGIQGTVVDADGRGVKGAKVIFSLPDGGPYFENGAQSDDDKYIWTETQMGGQFMLSEQETKWAILVVADEGYAHVSDEEFAELKREIKLTPWATIRGKCMIGSRPAAGEVMQLQTSHGERFEGLPYTHFDYQTKVNDDGSFEFTRVPPNSSGVISRQIMKVKLDYHWLPMRSHARNYAVKAGETLDVTIGGTGRPVTAKIKLPDDDARKLREWNYGDHELTRVDGPADVLGPDERGIYGFYIESDGTLRAEDVPAGDYKLRIILQGPGIESVYDGPRIGDLSHEFTVPPIEGGRSDEPLDLGTLEIETD